MNETHGAGLVTLCRDVSNRICNIRIVSNPPLSWCHDENFGHFKYVCWSELLSFLSSRFTTPGFDNQLQVIYAICHKLSEAVHRSLQFSAALCCIMFIWKIPADWLSYRRWTSCSTSSYSAAYLSYKREMKFLKKRGRNKCASEIAPPERVPAVSVCLEIQTPPSSLASDPWTSATHSKRTHIKFTKLSWWHQERQGFETIRMLQIRVRNIGTQSNKTGAVCLVHQLSSCRAEIL